MLEDLGANPGRFDLVICDPPKLAQTQKGRDGALGAYQRLATSACRATRPGGLLVFCSCSGAITTEDLVRALAIGARQANLAATVLERWSQGGSTSGVGLTSLLAQCPVIPLASGGRATVDEVDSVYEHSLADPVILQRVSAWLGEFGLGTNAIDTTWASRLTELGFTRPSSCDLGVLAERRGKLSIAEGRYRDALAVAPDFAEARMNLARLLFARSAFDEAREQFARLTEVAPQNPVGYLGLAEAYLKLARLTEGEETLMRYRSLFGDTPEALVVVARQLLARGDHEGAEETLSSVTHHRDATVAARAWAWIAIARIEGGKRESAQDAVREALRFDATDTVALHAQSLSTASEGERPLHRRGRQ